MGEPRLDALPGCRYASVDDGSSLTNCMVTDHVATGTATSRLRDLVQHAGWSWSDVDEMPEALTR